MPKQVFYLTTPTARATVKQAIDCAPDNYRVEIRERTRTLDQNALLHALITSLSKQVKWMVNGRLETLSIDDWKCVLTASLHQEQRIASGIRGGFIMLGRKTSTMKVGEMTELIEFVKMFCAEQGVNIDEVKS